MAPDTSADFLRPSHYLFSDELYTELKYSKIRLLYNLSTLAYSIIEPDKAQVYTQKRLQVNTRTLL